MRKKVWSKPECARIKLVPAEAVASECKKVTNLNCLPGGKLAKSLVS